MRLFITLSLIIHAASLSYFVWHKQQDKKLVDPPMSTIIHIVSTPEDFEEPPEPKTIRTSSDKLPKKKNIQRKRKTKSPPKTISRKGPSLKDLEYAQKLQAFIEKNRSYPRQALRLKHQGTVVISLTILNDGRFSEVKLVERSKHQTLDKAALSFIRDLKSFDPLPNPNLKRQEYIFPILYKIGG